MVTDPYEGNQGLNARVVFGGDGKLYMSTGGRVGNLAQDLASLRGKILRLNDDGSAAPDNPFAGEPGHRPEIYTLGHRNTLGLILHPATGDLWNHENGPNGGDEINVILPGRNYGWPLVSFGRLYPGARVSEHPTREGIESPLVVWLPAIAVGRHGGLHGRPSFLRGAATCSWGPCGRAGFRARGTCSASCSTSSTRSCGARPSSWSCGSASGRCARGPTDCFTC